MHCLRACCQNCSSRIYTASRGSFELHRGRILPRDSARDRVGVDLALNNLTTFCRGFRYPTGAMQRCSVALQPRSFNFSGAFSKYRLASCLYHALKIISHTHFALPSPLPHPRTPIWPSGTPPDLAPHHRPIERSFRSANPQGEIRNCQSHAESRPCARLSSHYTRLQIQRRLLFLERTVSEYYECVSLLHKMCPTQRPLR